MSGEPTTEPNDGRVGFRDIYRAVNESESRIKEHMTLLLLPVVTQVADHENRIRTIETQGSDEARQALARTDLLDTRLTIVENAQNATVERRTGSLAILSAQRSFIILIGVIATLFLTILILLDRVAK
jgi:hypothetical protein